MADLRTDQRWVRKFYDQVRVNYGADPAVAELLDLISEYGNAKFGDEWWPGNAEPYLGKEKGDRINELLDVLTRR